MRTEVWRQTIITLRSEHKYDNPFLDVCITAEFTGPSGRTIMREAYWDGEEIYKISFAPTEPGVWRYRVAAPEETGLNGVEGSLEAVIYEGELPIYRHGFLKREEGKSYLMHDDGTPFFWLGDTHWDFAVRERWNESNHPEMDSMFRGMADRRAEQGYNVYQTNLRSEENEQGISPFWESGREDDLPNVEFYQNELDRRMMYLADKGFVNALGLAWFQASGLEGENIPHIKNLARYIIARYGALPVAWTLCGEVAGFEPGKVRENYLKYWREVALYIESKDGYGNLQTAHAWSEIPYASYYEGEDWFDFTLNQAGHGNLPIHSRYYREFFKTYHDKPFVEGESMYELCSTLEELSPRLCTDAIVRRAAYTAIQCGCCGYTYGAQGIWDSVWDQRDFRPWMPVFNRYNKTWIDGIDAPGGRHMGLMKEFYEKHRFYEMHPDIDKRRVRIMFEAEIEHMVLANDDCSRFIIYFSNSPVGSCMLYDLPDAEYKAVWFNPRTGEYTDCSTFRPEGGTWESPFAPDFDDWLMVVERI